MPENIDGQHVSELSLIRGRFSNAKVRRYLEQIFSAQEIENMEQSGVDRRMIFGINPHYHALATGGGLTLRDGTRVLPDMPPSKALLALIMPRMNETFDLKGQHDPSHQMQYSPKSLKGRILHKYDEIVLGHTALACSAHCRYCYRLDLFNRSTGKGLVQPDELRDYIRSYNDALRQNKQLDPETGQHRYPIREVLLSGGDPMIMTNDRLSTYLVAAAQAGVKIVRIGTKELSFRPERFDDGLYAMLQAFHDLYPAVHLNFVAHFSHPDEFLERDEGGNYVNDGSGLLWLSIVRHAVRELLSFDFVTIENQTPIIDRVNDNSDVQRVLHQELRDVGIRTKYIFQCREIEGHRAFSVPVEKAWRIHNESQKGVSDSARSRYVLATEDGKIEVVSVIDEPSDAVLGSFPEHARSIMKSLLRGGLVIFKMYRSPAGADTLGKLLVAKRNPDALWLSGYEDRILFDCRKPNGFDQQALLAKLCDQDVS